MHAMQTLNLSGMKCPLPIVALAKFVRELAPGESFCLSPMIRRSAWMYKPGVGDRPSVSAARSGRHHHRSDSQAPR